MKPTARPAAWALRSRRLPLGERTLVMGIVNVTPDSFSDGGRYFDTEAAIAHGSRQWDEGADLVDIGGESTRPGAPEVPAAEEIRRVVPVVAALAAQGVVVSVDTSKVEVAAAALDAGAEVINDVTSLQAAGMAELVASRQAGLVLMHMLGTPRTMQDDPQYGDVVAEVQSFLLDRARVAERAGVPRERIAIDPGIGFGKTVEHNLLLLHHLDGLVATGYPVLVGTSRKSFLGAIVGIEEPEHRDVATTATVALAAATGVAVVRVHNVAQALQAIQVASAIVQPHSGPPR